jgi:hypothetical protein
MVEDKVVVVEVVTTMVRDNCIVHMRDAPRHIAGESTSTGT